MKSVKQILILVLAVLTLDACCPLPLQPSTSPIASSPGSTSPLPAPWESESALDSGRLVFDAERNGVYQIYTYDIKSGKLTQLTKSSARNIEPAWSPDGSRIAFSSADGNGERVELTVMNADGSGIIPLTADGAFAVHPDWSPDGEHIAFHSNRTGDFEVYVINPDGTGLTNLTNHPSADFMPAWSPDGKEIAFVSTRTNSFNIFLMMADGTNVRQLTNATSSDSYYPCWSPDGTKIVFTQKVPSTDEIILVMSADGTDVQQLTSPGYNSSTPTWSSDGQYIIFSSDRDGYWRLYTMRPDGSDQAVLTTLGQHPDWVP